MSSREEARAQYEAALMRDPFFSTMAPASAATGTAKAIRAIVQSHRAGSSDGKEGEAEEKEEGEEEGETSEEGTFGGNEFIPFDLAEPSSGPSSSSSSSSSAAAAAAPSEWQAEWVPRNRVYRHDKTPPFGALHEEILDFCAYVSPTPGEHAMREDLVARVRAVATDLFPRCKLKVFGSFATRLYLPTSDIDMVVVQNSGERRQVKSCLHKLSAALRTRLGVTGMQVISKARVPIIKFTDERTGVAVDISFDQEMGVDGAAYVRRVLRQSPAFRPLLLVLKHFLFARELGDTFTGGVGSFLLQLMLAHFFRAHPMFAGGGGGGGSGRAGRGSARHLNLGTLLVAFLRHFGCDFNFVSVGLRAGGDEMLFAKMARGWYDSSRPGLVSAENPLDEGHDVGKNSYQMVRVRAAFRHAHEQLLSGWLHRTGRRKVREELARGSAAARAPTLLSQVIQINGAVLEARETFRRVVEEFGYGQAVARGGAGGVGGGVGGSAGGSGGESSSDSDSDSDSSDSDSDSSSSSSSDSDSESGDPSPRGRKRAASEPAAEFVSLASSSSSDEGNGGDDMVLHAHDDRRERKRRRR